ncbi:Os08g0462850 [Oryza sativa Japonica Group]|uniref:Os08g0462850 protein n=1 Tax=Oryza sativa subsp. japonica TaxID=39947 RepID=A0A0P0XGM5_ORYSJ|nr:Os08g0462850 [Oryza sativa Japonica Group]
MGRQVVVGRKRWCRLVGLAKSRSRHSWLDLARERSPSRAGSGRGLGGSWISDVERPWDTANIITDGNPVNSEMVSFNRLDLLTFPELLAL